DPAGTGHVADNHLRRTGNVLAEMIGDHPRERVVATASRRADDQRHCLAAIEFGGRLGQSGLDAERGEDERKRQTAERTGPPRPRRISGFYRSREGAERNPGFRGPPARPAALMRARQRRKTINARAPAPPAAAAPRCL